MESSADAKSGCDPNVLDRIGEGTVLSTVLQNSGVGIVATGGEGTLIVANSKAADMFGYEVEELIGWHVSEILELDTAHGNGADTLPTEGDVQHVVGRHRQGHRLELEVITRTGTANDTPLRTAVIREHGNERRFDDDFTCASTIVETVGDGIYELDLEGRFVNVNDVICDVTGYARDELIGEFATTVLEEEAVEECLDVIQSLMESDTEDAGTVEMHVQTSEEDVIPVEARIALVETEGKVAGTVGVVRDIRRRKKREQMLEHQRNELAELARINAVIRDINQMLVGATSREEIEQAVCNRLVGSDSYMIAWIGSYRATDRTVEPTAVAGVDRSEVDSIELFEGADLGGHAHVDVLEELQHEPTTENVRDVAAEYEFDSTAAVPIRYEESLYGTLYLYADREFGFTEREREVLNELGDTIGLAINGLENRKLLHADTVLELTFSVTDPSWISRETRTADCTIELIDVVPRDDDGDLYYLSVTNCPPEIFLDRIADDVDGGSVINGEEDGGLVMIESSNANVVRSIMDAGAQIHEATASEGQLRIVAHVAPDADITALVERVERIAPEADLIAQCEIERPIQTSRSFRESIKRDLTDKQLAALEAAYRARYFERPRPITGGEIADSLGVTASTFHHHLQAALDKTVSAIFAT